MDSLTQAFAIDVASYAIMSNHYHLVVRVDADKAQHWSWQEVVARWHQIYQGNMLSQCFMRGETLPTAERKILQSKAEVWRTRLSDISWFMSAMTEHIARLANAEEGVSGTFWQARFFSQALLDEQAIPRRPVCPKSDPSKDGRNARGQPIHQRSATHSSCKKRNRAQQSIALPRPGNKRTRTGITLLTSRLH